VLAALAILPTLLAVALVLGLMGWLDIKLDLATALVASVALGLMKEATGRPDPLEALRPAKAATLPPRIRIGFWSLVAGVGSSTTAALVAHRSAGAGRVPVLVDLDRWAPSLALRAGLDSGATVADALLRPGRERECLSRWSDVPVLPGAPGLHAMFDGERITQLLTRLASDEPVVIDLGTGADALDEGLVGSLDRLCVVVGPRSAQLQAAFCSVAVLHDLRTEIGLVTVGAADSDAQRIAARLPWRHVGTIPADPYLAADDFAARAPTMVAVDRLIRACA